MDARIANTVGDLMRRLPVKGAGRELALQRLTDIYAEREAAAAVRAAAARSRESLRKGDPDGKAVENAVSAASALSDLGVVDAGRLDIDLATDALRREQLSGAFVDPAFLAVVPDWIVELRQVAAVAPGSGACTIASAMQLWLWTISHLQKAPAQRATSELAQAFSPLIAARAQIFEVVREGSTAGHDAATRDFFLNLCHIQAARAAGAVGMLCAELVFGYRRHPKWDAEGCATCYRSEDLDALEGWMPGIASSARAHSDVIEADGTHAAKAGPCARADGIETFLRLRAKLDGCLTGARVARDRAAAALPSVLTSAAGSPR